MGGMGGGGIGGLQSNGNGSSRGSQEQASSPQTRRVGAQRHDRVPVTPFVAPPPHGGGRVNIGSRRSSIGGV